jgi:hypothetical protein
LGLPYIVGMPKRLSKEKTNDVNVIAASIVRMISEDHPSKQLTRQKNPAAVALGHLGGLKGGKARAERLSPKRRSEIASLAAKSRWKKGRNGEE